MGPRVLVALAAAAALGACVDEVAPADYGDPTSLATASTVGGITARIDAPIAPASSEQRPTFRVVAWTADAAPLTATVAVNNGPAQALTVTGSPAEHQTFEAQVGLVHGANRVVFAFQTADGKRFRRLAYPVSYGGDAPGIRVTRVTAADGQGCPSDAADVVGVTRAPRVCVWIAADKGAASLTTLTVATSADQASSDVSEGTTRAYAVAVTPDAAQAVTVTATDEAGLSGTAEVDFVTDDTQPTLLVDAVPAETGDTSVVISGSAHDAHGVASIDLVDASGFRQPVVVGERWSVTAHLAIADNDLALVATDGAGNTTTSHVRVQRVRRYTLGAPLQPGAPLTLSLDKEALGELITVPDQKRLILSDVDLRPAMIIAFAAVKDPDVYGTDTSTWTAVEWNASKVLNLTPDNLDLTGTSLEQLLDVSKAVGIPPARILAETFGIAPTEPVLRGDQIVDALIDGVVGSHPNAAFDAEGRPIFVLSVYDVLQDLTTLGERYGPVGDHPGLIGPVTHGDLLEPGFAMNVTAQSEFVRYDGVDGSRATKDFLFRLPPGKDAVSFDFEDPATFSVYGLKDEPTIDFDFKITGYPDFIKGGTERYVNPDPDNPGFYRGNGRVWTLAPYYDEHVITESAYRLYSQRFADQGYTYTHTYSAGNLEDVATVHWDRGWIEITTKGNIGNPPPPSYAWDTLSEVAQTRGHDGNLPENGPPAVFPLRHVSVGLTADDLIATVRPKLQSQAATMSEILVGHESIVAPTVDFFFVPAADAGAHATASYLYFRAPSDSERAYGYSKPGFYTDRALTSKLSTTTIAGVDDASHEKIALVAGTTFYYLDDAGTTFAVAVDQADNGGATVEVTPVPGSTP